MNVGAREAVRLAALIVLVASGTCAAAGSNLPHGYPVPDCGERPEIPERPEKFETEEAIAEYNAKVDAYNATMEQLVECVREYVNNAASDIEQIRKRSRDAIERLNRN